MEAITKNIAALMEGLRDEAKEYLGEEKFELQLKDYIAELQELMVINNSDVYATSNLLIDRYRKEGRTPIVSKMIVAAMMEIVKKGQGKASHASLN
ncbi:MAG: hypothetical protein CSYNP_03533 [Syntrophus sp. SKADARSKE-3]|nr:hypothetical protein [Syntrophus sp. SKADARSKE-3]